MSWCRWYKQTLLAIWCRRPWHICVCVVTHYVVYSLYEFWFPPRYSQDFITQLVPGHEDANDEEVLHKLLAGIGIIWRSVVANGVPPRVCAEHLDHI